MQQLRRSMSALHLVDAAARELTESRARELAAAEHLLQVTQFVLCPPSMVVYPCTISQATRFPGHIIDICIGA